MAKIVLTDEEKAKLDKLIAKGLSKGEALIKMGKAVKVEQKVEELKKAITPKKEKEKVADPDKTKVMTKLTKTIEKLDGVVIKEQTGRAIEFTYNDADYTVSVVKHKA